MMRDCTDQKLIDLRNPWSILDLQQSIDIARSYIFRRRAKQVLWRLRMVDIRQELVQSCVCSMS